MAYPVEMVYRAFALTLDYVSHKKASEILREHYGEENAPVEATIKNWAKAGECTQGVSWYKIREASDMVRGRAAADYVHRQPKAHADWMNETVVQLEDLQDAVVAAVKIGKADVKLSDLPKLIQARQLIEGNATQRIEIDNRRVNVLGRIIRAGVEFVLLRFKGNKEVEHALKAVVDYTADEFSRFTLYTGDPDKFEIGLSIGNSNGRVLPGRSNRK